jgi:hypothetical protein
MAPFGSASVFQRMPSGGTRGGSSRQQEGGVELGGGGPWHGVAEGTAGRRRPVARRGGVEGLAAVARGMDGGGVQHGAGGARRDARRRRGVTRGGGRAPRRELWQQSP